MGQNLRAMAAAVFWASFRQQFATSTRAVGLLETELDEMLHEIGFGFVAYIALAYVAPNLLSDMDAFMSDQGRILFETDASGLWALHRHDSGGGSALLKEVSRSISSVRP